MKTRNILKTLLAIATCLLATHTFAQGTLYLHNADKFGAHKSIDLTDTKSITFKAKTYVLHKNDGTTKSYVYSKDYDYFTYKNPGLGIYCPIELRNNDFDDANSQWCWERSKQSDHFIVFWDNGFGSDPKVGKGSVKFDVDDLLDNAEYYYRMYTDSLGFALPGTSKTLDTYKSEIYVNSKAEWLATGSGYDDVIGALWCNYSAVNSPSTLAHEIGHSFQYIVACDLGQDHGWRYGFGSGASGGCAWWESCANWQAYRCYPDQKFSSWYQPSYFNLNLLHETWRYYNHFIQDYWTMLHGDDFIGRMWRESVKPEDPVETYKRITSIDQKTFNDQIWDYAARTCTWDIDALRDIKNKREITYAKLNLIDDTNHIWQVAEKDCPQNYGFNVVQMTKRDAGTVVKAHFKGIAGADGYRSVNTDKAGWRYGFVAQTNDGTLVYGTPSDLPDSTVEFTLPDDIKNLWFVVTGAPTDHWRHAWDDSETDDEQWPYQVQFENTDLNGYFQDKDAVAHDATYELACQVQYKPGGQSQTKAIVDLSELAATFALSPQEMPSIANQADATMCSFGVDKDGSRIIGTTSNMYSYLPDGTIVDYQADSTDILFYVTYMSYYKGFYIILNNQNPDIKVGDSYLVPVGIRYRAPDGKEYFATYNITINII